MCGRKDSNILKLKPMFLSCKCLPGPFLFPAAYLCRLGSWCLSTPKARRHWKTMTWLGSEATFLAADCTDLTDPLNPCNSQLKKFLYGIGIDGLGRSDWSELHVFVRPAGRRILSLLPPVDTEDRIDGGDEVVDYRLLDAAPARLDALSGDIVGFAENFLAFDTAAEQSR